MMTIVLGMLACHYAQETACGHHGLRARCSCAAAALAYSAYAILYALAG